MGRVLCWVAALMAVVGSIPVGLAQPAAAPPRAAGTGVLEIEFIPAKRAQIALWIEDAQGEFLETVRLTEAVSYRGIGNRPGASQMNSGFRWPYGRREGVLPIWAHARASAPDAELWRRVIFQNRTSEGKASRTSNDQSTDDYYCLSFDRMHATKDALDAVSCATVFGSDKGRFITDSDVAAGYAEPYEDPVTGEGDMRPLSSMSLYPPRRDASYCDAAGCFDHEDVERFADHALAVMPELDAVTMATPVGGERQKILVSVPSDWEPGSYRACLEINVEGDYNRVFNDETYPTPRRPSSKWDSWAITFGYPFRGQPSVVYCVPFELETAQEEQTFSTAEPAGSAGMWDLESPNFGELQSMEGMTDDPAAAPGSGADRLYEMPDGSRLRVRVQPALSCDANAPPGEVRDLELRKHGERLHAHQWAELYFRAAPDDRGVFDYDVRVSTEPITDDKSFMAARPAKNATLEAEQLTLPADTPEGEMVAAEMGGLVQQTHYFVGVRAVDGCASTGPIEVAEYTTPEREFATVSPCFVATAAWGSPLAAEVDALRRLRDRYLMTNALGRAFVRVYYRYGPAAARVIAEHEGLRTAARWALTPLVKLAGWLDD